MAINFDEENKFKLGADIKTNYPLSNIPQEQSNWGSLDFGKWGESLMNYNAPSTNKNEPNSGLGGFGTTSQWETGIGLAKMFQQFQGNKLRKQELAGMERNNKFNASLGIANYGMKYDLGIADFLQAQGKAQAVGDWVSTQGGDATKYNNMVGLALPKKANLTYG
jgi:hypothetical protein